jgi:hypothetical protein
MLGRRKIKPDGALELLDLAAGPITTSQRRAGFAGWPGESGYIH